jgi:hypothetical protein
MDSTQALTYLDNLCDSALQMARAGDTTLANRLGANPALAHYFHNVHNLKALTPAAWAQIYPHYLNEAARIHAEAEQPASFDARLSAIETQLAKLLELVTGKI